MYFWVKNKKIKMNFWIFLSKNYIFKIKLNRKIRSKWLVIKLKW